MIPPGVTEIGKYAFEGCESLTSVVISEGVTEIGESAFEDCKSLTSVAIPSSVTIIGEMAFFGCSSLESIEFGGTVSQWKAVEKGEDWHKWCDVAVVHCSDGDAEL